MNQKKAKEIRSAVKNIAGDRIQQLAYMQAKTGSIKVSPVSQRGMIKAMKATIKGKK